MKTELFLVELLLLRRPNKSKSMQNSHSWKLSVWLINPGAKLWPHPNVRVEVSSCGFQKGGLRGTDARPPACASSPSKQRIAQPTPNPSPSHATPWSITTLPIDTSTNHFIFSFSFFCTRTYIWQREKDWARERVGCPCGMWPALLTKEQVENKTH